MRNKIWKAFFPGILAAGALLYVFAFPCMAARFPSRMVRNRAETEYGESRKEFSLEQMLKIAKEQEAVLTGEAPDRFPDSRFLVRNREENDLRVASAAGGCFASGGSEAVFYAVGENYVPEGSVLPAVYGRGIEYSCSTECDTERDGKQYVLTRFAARRTGESGEAGENDGTDGDDGTGGGSGTGGSQSLNRKYWNPGDVVTRKLGGKTYRFCCVDQNYREESTSGQSLALFLCESVIPADTGSRYIYEQKEDGRYDYVFYPGPLTEFGESSEYKDSAVRKWLKQQEEKAEGIPAVNTGVDRGCRGQTAVGAYSRLDPADLRFYDMGKQILTDRYFILSVEEALHYRDFLWRIDGCDEEESGRRAEPCAKGYWLRTPAGNRFGGDTDCVYVVDLIDGNLHPQPVRASGWDGAEKTGGETDMTCPAGVRPAFVLPQEN